MRSPSWVIRTAAHLMDAVPEFPGKGPPDLRPHPPNPHAAAFPEWRTDHGAMAMEITAGHGVAHGVNGAHVGLTWENGRAEWARLTPIPQAPSDSPGRSPWLML